MIAATHQNLEDRVARGLFREDLFHRLNVIRMELPPLRARREDVGDLLDHYLRIAATELGVEPKPSPPMRGLHSKPTAGRATCASSSIFVGA